MRQDQSCAGQGNAFPQADIASGSQEEDDQRPVPEIERVGNIAQVAKRSRIEPAEPADLKVTGENDQRGAQGGQKGNIAREGRPAIGEPAQQDRSQADSKQQSAQAGSYIER